MNILLTTSAIILVLTLASYARIDLFRLQSGFSAVMAEYMIENERSALNARALKRYDEVHPSSKNKTPGNENQIKGIKKLSLKAWLNKADREKNMASVTQVRQLFSRLLVILYANEPFWINRMKKESISDPEQLAMQLAIAIEGSADRFTEATPLTSIRQLELLNLGEWQELYSTILNGCPCLATQTDANSLDASMTDEDDGEVPEDAIDLGRCTIRNLISLDSRQQISIWLTSKTMLQALYQSPILVEDILQTRAKLLRDYVNQPESRAVIQEAFNRFKNEHAEISPTLLDFTISKTRP